MLPAMFRDGPHDADTHFRTVLDAVMKEIEADLTDCVADLLEVERPAKRACYDALDDATRRRLCNALKRKTQIQPQELKACLVGYLIAKEQEQDLVLKRLDEEDKKDEADEADEADEETSDEDWEEEDEEGDYDEEDDDEGEEEPEYEECGGQLRDPPTLGEMWPRSWGH